MEWIFAAKESKRLRTILDDHGLAGETGFSEGPASQLGVERIVFHDEDARRRWGVHFSGVLQSRNGEEKGGTFAGLGLDPNMTAVMFDNALADGEAEPLCRRLNMPNARS